ncbi:MAG: methyltransferase domain-containing protein [Acidobacteriota bacterium]
MRRRTTVHYKKIDFERELRFGSRAYDRVVGRWWLMRSLDRPHAYAYRKIALYARSAVRGTPGTIVDYGCGSGPLLARLARVFPRSRLLGIDGSALMLRLARERLRRLGPSVERRVTLVHTQLPDPTLRRGVADLVVYAFPQIVPPRPARAGSAGGRAGAGSDAAVARVLASAREPDPEEETVTQDPESLFESLMEDREISRNIRRLLKRGATCVRVEYSNAARGELTELVRMRTAFEEGSLRRPVGGARAARLFRFARSSYFRSRVMEDVYHQTRDRSDREGGYFVSILRAV